MPGNREHPSRDGQGQTDKKCAPTTHAIAVSDDLAAMQFDETPGQRKPDAEPPSFVAGDIRRLGEQLEKSPLHLVGDAIPLSATLMIA
jgi:hypothetical protein